MKTKLLFPISTLLHNDIVNTLNKLKKLSKLLWFRISKQVGDRLSLSFVCSWFWENSSLNWVKQSSSSTQNLSTDTPLLVTISDFPRVSLSYSLLLWDHSPPVGPWKMFTCPVYRGCSLYWVQKM